MKLNMHDLSTKFLIHSWDIITKLYTKCKNLFIYSLFTLVSAKNVELVLQAFVSSSYID